MTAISIVGLVAIVAIVAIVFGKSVSVNRKHADGACDSLAIGGEDD